MTTTSRCRKFTYSIINTQLWERESARALQTIRKYGWIFAEVVYNWWRHKIPRYTGIMVFLRRYIIVGYFVRYDTVGLRALKSWRDGQLNLAHGPETKNSEKIKIKNRVAQKERCRQTVIPRIPRLSGRNKLSSSSSSRSSSASGDCSFQRLLIRRPLVKCKP